jgi:hypothetical protein
MLFDRNGSGNGGGQKRWLSLCLRGANQDHRFALRTSGRPADCGVGGVELGTTNGTDDDGHNVTAFGSVNTMVSLTAPQMNGKKLAVLQRFVPSHYQRLPIGR